jgi:hypothetical protein
VRDASRSALDFQQPRRCLQLAPACPAQPAIHPIAITGPTCREQVPDDIDDKGPAALMADRWQAKLPRLIVMCDLRAGGR